MYGVITYGPSSCGGCVSTDPRITEFQIYLQSLGYGPSQATGTYGNETYEAVMRFQRDHGLSPDGRILDDPESDTHSRLRTAAGALQYSKQVLAEGGAVDPEQARLLLELAGHAGTRINITQEKWFWPAVVGLVGVVGFMYVRGRSK